MTTQERDIYYKILTEYKKIKEELRCIKCNNLASVDFSTYNSVYDDNADALAGGLVAGQVYRTSTGQLMVTY